MNQIICLLARYKPVTDFFIGLIPIVLTIFGVYIAIQQYRTNRKKLKLDLFEKRYEVFSSINKFIGVVARSRRFDHQHGNDFLAGTRGAEFLFDSHIKSYVNEIWIKACDLETWANDEKTSDHAVEKAVHMKWFVAQFIEVDERFKKYMQLSH